MTRPLRPEVTDQVVELFRAYYERHPTWGSLHVVLDDANWSDETVAWCREWAIEKGDNEGWLLAQILLGYSKGQRHKIGERAELAQRGLDMQRAHLPV